MQIGEIIRERYQIDHVLGWGNMGITYRAADLKTQRPVAVKQLHLTRLQEWKTLEMFEREAKILQQLKHPNIPAYIEYFSLETPSDVQFLLVQEYIEGRTLQQLVDEGWRGTEENVLAIVWQLVEILFYLHTLDPPVIHRDINPKNIILSSEKKVYLVDFGAVQERIRTTVFGGSTIVGTFGYVPFEQFSGRAVPASDYYALGATLLYLLTHRHPVDFPTKDLKPMFHTSLQASPKIFRLLDTLLEPSVKKRIASPKQIKAVLEETSERVREEAVAKSLMPRDSKIKKVIKGENHLCFRIPAKKSVGERIMLFSGFIGHWALGVIFIISGIPGLYLFSIPFWLLGGIALCACIEHTFGEIFLDLTPEQIQVSYKCFGIGYSRHVPLASLQRSDITYHFEKHKPVFGINHAGKTVIIGSRLLLTKSEIDWLTQELREYVSTNLFNATIDIHH